jgi:hypothetical protein
MIVDLMKFFSDIFYPILGDSSKCASRLARQDLSFGGQRNHDDIHAAHLDRRRLSVATPALSAGMRSGGRRDVAVDAGMIIGVEPSGALRTVIGTITETLPLLRQCSRACAQQQPHCHDKFCYAHG